MSTCPSCHHATGFCPSCHYPLTTSTALAQLLPCDHWMHNLCFLAHWEDNTTCLICTQHIEEVWTWATDEDQRMFRTMRYLGPALQRGDCPTRDAILDSIRDDDPLRYWDQARRASLPDILLRRERRGSWVVE
ncbi:hypothetical protein M8818_002191 [Zalaria obscura]|uniref:Uncharacterized protein n=1 Tax=Zalaria obscura TaxID=2024903 RepID=A0ACC3SMM5_9PEZI